MYRTYIYIYFYYLWVRLRRRNPTFRLDVIFITLGRSDFLWNQATMMRFRYVRYGTELLAE
jgi:hypothetical protein